MRFFIILLLLSSNAMAADEYNTIESIWIYENDNSYFSIAIKENNNEFLAFHLTGDASILTDKIKSVGRSRTVTQPFTISDTSSFILPIEGVARVTDDESGGGETTYQDITVPLRGSFRNGALSVFLEDGSELRMSKAGFLQSAIEYSKLILSSLISFVLYAVAMVLALRHLVRKSRTLSSKNVDKRYKELTLKNGRTGRSVLFLLVVGVGLIFVVYHFILGFLGIGGFLDHVIFWTY